MGWSWAQWPAGCNEALDVVVCRETGLRGEFAIHGAVGLAGAVWLQRGSHDDVSRVMPMLVVRESLASVFCTLQMSVHSATRGRSCDGVVKFRDIMMSSRSRSPRGRPNLELSHFGSNRLLFIDKAETAKCALC